jgi:hypothetical protein
MSHVYIEDLDGTEYRISGMLDADLDEVRITHVHRAGHHHVHGVFRKRWLTSSARELEQLGLLLRAEEKLSTRCWADIEAARAAFAESDYESRMERQEVGE